VPARERARERERERKEAITWKKCDDNVIQSTLSYRGTSLIRTPPPPQDHHRALDIVLR